MAIYRWPGHCPVCGFRVPTPPDMESLWSGVTSTGAPAGGGVHAARCRLCRAGLIAYSDVYDEAGHVAAMPEPGEEPALVWSLRGVPWQTLSLMLAAGAAIW